MDSEANLSPLVSRESSPRNVSTNLGVTITIDDATRIAKKEARRRGRDKMRVMSRTFKNNEWIIGLEFEPYDQIGNQSWVYVTTNGVVKWYIHGH